MVARNHISRINSFISSHAQKYNYPYQLFGIFGVITYPLFYFLWGGINLSDHLNLVLRIIAVALCSVLALHHYWPRRLQACLPMYWYITVCYCLPYLFTLLSLKGGLSNIWLLNSLTVVVLMVLLLDTASLIILLTVGVLLGLFTYISIFGRIVYSSDISYFYVFISYASAIFFGVIFSHYKQLLTERSSRLEAEKANEMKSEFIANMSHDIRTPVAGISGMLDGILYEITDFQEREINANAPMSKSLRDLIEKVNEYTGYAKKSCSSLSSLFDEILEISRIDSNSLERLNERFNLRTLITSCDNVCRPIAAMKGIRFSIDIEKNTPIELFGNAHYFKRILLNLISNAIKFTNQGDVYVYLSSSLKKNNLATIHLSVKDTGIGISKDHYQSIFDKFTRVVPSYKGIYQGVGLGLYEVKRYVDLMDGEINIDSKIGVGTLFTLDLPFRITGDSDDEAQAEYSDGRVSTISTSAPQILLVEDNAIAAKAAKIIIEHLGGAVDVAVSGREAVNMSNHKNYDLVFMDIGLPDADGISVAETIIESSDRPINVIALTGHASDEIKANCFRSGMSYVLNKPATEAKIKAIFSELLPNFKQ